MAGRLGPGSPRQVGRGGTDRALGDPHIERVDRRVGDLDELFARARLRIGKLVELKGATDGVKSCCAHPATVRRVDRGDAEPVGCRSMIILDGGTGTLVQSLGAPMDGDTWCADANLTHPEIVRRGPSPVPRGRSRGVDRQHVRDQPAAVQPSRPRRRRRPHRCRGGGVGTRDAQRRHPCRSPARSR